MDRTVVHGLKAAMERTSSNPLTSSSGMRCGVFRRHAVPHYARWEAEGIVDRSWAAGVVPVFWGRLSLPRTVAG